MPECLRQAVARTKLHVFVFRFANRCFRTETVVLQIAVAIFIGQNTALATTAFGHQDARTRQAGWVVLHEFHIAQRYAVTIGQCHAVTGHDTAVGVVQVHAPCTAGGDDHAFCLNCDGFTGLNVQTQSAVQLAVLDQ